MIIKKDIVVIDLETTGFNEYTDDVIEVGLVKFNGDTLKEIESYGALIKTDKKLSQRIVELTGITQEMLINDGKDRQEVIKKVQDMCRDCVIVAHNVQFDFKFLEVQFELEPTYYYDTLSIARVEYPHFKNHKLGTICNEFGIDLSNAHRALHDAEATKNVLIAMLNNKNEVAKKHINAIANNKYGISYKPKNTRKVFN